jgi:hypothetical protein
MTQAVELETRHDQSTRSDKVTLVASWKADVDMGQDTYS